MRLFVAVWPTEDVRYVLSGLDLPPDPAVRRVGPEGWHVTLRFVGEVDDADLPALVRHLEPVAAAVGPVPVDVGPTTGLLGPGVLMAPATGLDRLAGAVRAATARFGDPEDPRPFVGHLTLARARGRGRVPPDLVGRPVAARWEARTLAVVRSHRGAGGPRYDDVATLALTGGAAQASKR